MTLAVERDIKQQINLYIAVEVGLMVPDIHGKLMNFLFVTEC